MKMGLKWKGLVGWFAVLASAGSLAGAIGNLAEAVKARDKEATRSLLQQRADVNAPRPDGSTALQWAAHWDDLETAELLIRAGAKVNAADDYGVTPLTLACGCGP
jgi:ankyrin repeat protein